MTNREEWLADAVTGLADALDPGFSLTAFSDRLARDLSELLAPAEVALAVADEHGELRIEGATSERVLTLASVDLGERQGPCTDSYRSGGQIRNWTLAGAADRWPQYAPVARAAGFRTAHALPLRCRAGAVGAAGVLAEGSDPLTDQQVRLADALVTSAAVSILHERAMRRSAEKSEQLQRALDSRVLVEQAKGLVAGRLGTDVDVAFMLLRAYARSRNLQLAGVCKDVLSRKLPPSALLTESHGRRQEAKLQAERARGARRAERARKPRRLIPGEPPP